MLNKLTIINFALIKTTEIEFNEKLNILTGETGSGKSIILEALNFVLGAKADKNQIKTGETECNVIAEFDISENKELPLILNSFDIEFDSTLIISRKLSIDGKGYIKVNGNTLNVSMLRKITSHLVDVHGQSEHFYLLNNANQLELIDKYASESIIPVKNELETIFVEYSSVLSSLKELGGEERDRNMRLDILKYQINEIENASLSVGEEEDLTEKRKQVQNKEKIFSSLLAVNESVNAEGNAQDVLSNALKMLSQIKDFSADFSSLYDRFYSAILEIEDIGSTAESFLDGLEDDNIDPNYIEQRLETIKSLKKKYGSSIEEINEYLEKSKIEKNKLENFNELSKDLLLKKEKQEKEIYNLYKKLRDARQKSAKIFTENVLLELKELGFSNANFIVKFNDFPSIDSAKFNSKNGIDEIEFLFTANIGEPVKPLINVISGGEISRFMLGIKAQSSKFNDIETFIFDEIDTGISGKTAKIVAEKFYKIALNTQIIAITHLPQIACMGDNNYLIEKRAENGKTVSTIKLLDNEEKNCEIVRLIGGSENSSSAKDLAKELINSAVDFKNKIINA